MTNGPQPKPMPQAIQRRLRKELQADASLVGVAMVAIRNAETGSIEMMRMDSDRLLFLGAAQEGCNLTALSTQDTDILLRAGVLVSALETMGIDPAGFAKFLTAEEAGEDGNHDE